MKKLFFFSSLILAAHVSSTAHANCTTEYQKKFAAIGTPAYTAETGLSSTGGLALAGGLPIVGAITAANVLGDREQERESKGEFGAIIQLLNEAEIGGGLAIQNFAANVHSTVPRVSAVLSELNEQNKFCSDKLMLTDGITDLVKSTIAEANLMQAGKN